MDNIQKLTQMANPGTGALDKLASLAEPLDGIDQLAKMANVSGLDELAAIATPVSAMDKLSSLAKASASARGVAASAAEALESAFGGSSGRNVGLNLFDDVLDRGWGSKLIEWTDPNTGKVIRARANKLPKDEIEALVRGKIINMDRSTIKPFLDRHGISIDQYNAWHQAAKKAKFGADFDKNLYEAPLKQQYISGKTRFTYRPKGAEDIDYHYKGKRLSDFENTRAGQGIEDSAGSAIPNNASGSVDALEAWAAAGRNAPGAPGSGLLGGLTNLARQHPLGAVGAGAGGMLLANNMIGGRRGY